MNPRVLTALAAGLVIVSLLMIASRGDNDPASITESYRAPSKASDGKEQNRSDRSGKREQTGDGSQRYQGEFSPLPPFDQEKLESLARDPSRNVHQLRDLIHRAAAERDTRFRYLLNQTGLRDEPALDLALSAYDYSVNGNEKALDHILEIHAKQDPGSDSDSVVTLTYLDEWDRTVNAFHSHFAQGTDGTGGDAQGSFWNKRKRLFPHQYRKFRSDGGVEMPESPGR